MMWGWPPVCGDLSGRLLRPLAQKLPNLIPNPPEGSQPCFLRTLHRGLVLERPVQPVGMPRIYRATLARVVADRQHVIKLPARKLVNALLSMP